MKKKSFVRSKSNVELKELRYSWLRTNRFHFMDLSHLMVEPHSIGFASLSALQSLQCYHSRNRCTQSSLYALVFNYFQFRDTFRFQDKNLKKIRYPYLSTGCNPGFYENATLDCMPCERGSFNEMWNQTSCTPCGEEQDTMDVGAANVSECSKFLKFRNL